ncbi:hypothetical protein J8I29_19475 [Labrys sp. LIt4]|uniref:DUF6152 family protein n=1 Tax=Labrys sp. LIt4 TaxID=2821355 RepID=UPI001ADF6343|nr:DUF6152 family protein [Labrys sp. LIt4]MBP0581518.1 hypothetical protein [Labrys sp. LIt4]
MTIAIERRVFLYLAGAGAAISLAPKAFAHHGWSWAEGEQMELKGTIKTVSMAPPHPSLEVAAEDGVLWRVDLANPGQTQRAGFTGDTAKPGDAVTVLGNRAKDRSKAWMKAVRVTIAGKNYDMYPDRIQTR